MFELIISICMGIGLAASTGLRVFIPLLVLSIASNLGWIPLNDNWAWSGNDIAIIVLSAASLVELGGYYIPVVDNLLDTITIPLATIAGTLIMVSIVSDLNPVFTWSLAVIAGGGTAAAISSTTSVARATSTTTTVGVGNPILSTAEAGFSGLLSIVSIFSPILAIIGVILLLVIVIKIYRRIILGKSS